jgi:hypothetical protein
MLTYENSVMAKFAEPDTGELPRIPLLETVWKLRTGSVSWSREAAQRGEIAHFSARGVTEKRLIRPVQILSRQSLYELR